MPYPNIPEDEIIGCVMMLFAVAVLVGIVIVLKLV
jgi:hypothetical protein